MSKWKIILTVSISLFAIAVICAAVCGYFAGHDIRNADNYYQSAVLGLACVAGAFGLASIANLIAFFVLPKEQKPDIKKPQAEDKAEEHKTTKTDFCQFCGAKFGANDVDCRKCGAARKD